MYVHASGYFESQRSESFLATSSSIARVLRLEKTSSINNLRILFARTRLRDSLETSTTVTGKVIDNLDRD